MSPKKIYKTDHQSHCYPSNPESFDQLYIDLWDDGDVRIQNEEADIATIRKKMEVLDAE